MAATDKKLFFLIVNCFVFNELVVNKFYVAKLITGNKIYKKQQWTIGRHPCILATYVDFITKHASQAQKSYSKKKIPESEVTYLFTEEFTKFASVSHTLFLKLK